MPDAEVKISKPILKGVTVYYAKAAVFTIASYGLLRLVYGHTGRSQLASATRELN
ncbi:hypothetical protein LMF57_05045 [Stenotrophomonas sp. SI-NJAU-1]|uniref:hypothetical protein n=1 Tax=Stenotrophomonas TaxID=40323 RepID=UPI001AA1586F|nr:MULTISPECIES: hypothetical protein [Stenotrophomonas]MBO1748478.1 hypothetical protein [Stenotrophomonas indicatrix]MDN8643960.1 hypothetical protein [Stenotrophomonas indicatrix]MDN8656659.1 hypothetical protein [Stenotrophomonas indicatrix]UEX20311.1 hypothetical protein LMF57_05045 [Stenotrophomonas sp. SI-NJAU-1]